MDLIMEEIVDQILDGLEEKYECKSAKFHKECCGDYFLIDSNYEGAEGNGFRITVRPENIELTRLFFNKVVISYASFQTAEQLLNTIKHCELIENQ